MGLKVIIENNIPFAKGLLDEYADVSYLSPRDITREAMASADALITRTRTRCDASLLEGSRCSIIASATIGLDHVDMDYCRNRGIKVVNAPGCNAPAVAQYVFASVFSVLGRDISDIVLGVVGVGHVGSIVERWGRLLGMEVLLCDPPRAYAEGGNGFVSLDEIARRADVITFHIPYTTRGEYATRHICDSRFLHTLSRRPVIINSSRGAVADTAALLQAHEEGIVGNLVIDCWENEPDIDRRLLEVAAVATPHIAGYSREGKVRATTMAVSAVARHFGLPQPVMPESVPSGAADRVSVETIMASYDPLVDTEVLRRDPQLFEWLRNNYNLRGEVRG